MVNNMKNILIIITIIIIFTTCREDEYIVVESNELNYMMFDDKVIFSPQNSEQGFVFVSRKNGKNIFACVDEDGNRIWEADMKNLIPNITPNYKVSNRKITVEPDGFLISFINKDIANGTNRTFFSAVKTNISGEIIWNLHDTIPNGNDTFPDNYTGYDDAEIFRFVDFIRKADNENILISSNEYDEYQIGIYNNQGDLLSEDTILLDFFIEHNCTPDKIINYNDSYLDILFHNSFEDDAPMFGIVKSDYSGNVISSVILNYEFDFFDVYNQDMLYVFHIENGNIIIFIQNYDERRHKFLEFDNGGNLINEYYIPLSGEMFIELYYNIPNNGSDIFVGSFPYKKAGNSEPVLTLIEYKGSETNIISHLKTSEFSYGLCLRKRTDGGFSVLGGKMNFGRRNMILVKTDENGLINQE